MTEIDVCNNALDLVGQGNHIASLDSHESKESDICARLYPLALQRTCDKYDWSFTRKDEAITDKAKLDIASLPYRFTYSIPDDVIRVIHITPITAGQASDLIVNPASRPQFSFRNVNNKKALVTNLDAPFALQYQGIVTDLDLLPPTFIEALEFYLASSIAISLIKGTTGYQIGASLRTEAEKLLQQAFLLDVPLNQEKQGRGVSTFINSRQTWGMRRGS